MVMLLAWWVSSGGSICLYKIYDYNKVKILCYLKWRLDRLWGRASMKMNKAWKWVNSK